MDWNGDGKKDLVAGDMNGAIWFFENEGSRTEPRLGAGVKLKAKGKDIVGGRQVYEMIDGVYRVTDTITGNPAQAQKYAKIHVADWNEDGLDDILVGYTKPRIVIMLNKGTRTAPEFDDAIVVEPETGTFPRRPSPYLVDWGGDGKKDLLLGSADGKVHIFVNIGDASKPRYRSGRVLQAGGKMIMKGTRARIDVADWNGDGKLDLVLGNFVSEKDEKAKGGRTLGGNIWFFPGL